MPVQILSTSFTDDFGNTLASYRSNAGDRVKLTMTILSSIRVSSITNPMILDPSLNTITISSGSWLDEGFRVGDTITFTLYSSGGSVIQTWTTLATFISDSVLDVNSVPYWYDITAGEFIVVEVANKAGRGDLEVFFNHVSNINGGNEFSLIDGEATRGVLTNLNALAVAGTQTAALTGKQSGQYVYEIKITRENTGVSNAKKFKIEITFVNSGIYDVSWFNSSDCLKTFVKLQWSRDTGDLSYLSKTTWTNNANTGWFDEGYNIDTINSTLISNISGIDYASPTNHTIVVDGPITNIGVGASYIPLDENYFKNKTTGQHKLGILAYTRNVTTAIQNSEINPNLAQFTITINSVTVVGTQTTIDLTFTPNNNFFSFFDSRDEGDRLFYFWVKCGNVNHLAFADQLSYNPPPSDPLLMINEKAFYDHSENINDGSGSDFTTVFNTEDDLAYFGSFLLDKNGQYDLFTARVEAYNNVTGENFTLLSANFDFTGIPISSGGNYLLNEVVAINSILPLTSLKREAKLYLEPTLDTSAEYGVSLYFPFILRWEYWLDQLNASVDFYPNQNKNWYQYQTIDWEVRLELQLNTPSSAHFYSKGFTINDYDSENDLLNTIDLKIESTSTPVGVIVEGEIMRITATHELLNGKIWDTNNIWGMITVEPKESAPRWLVSTVVPTDGNTLNPLSPISGSLVNITYPSASIAKMECFFDPSKINLSKGCKFTSKIKGCQLVPEDSKTTTSGIFKTTTQGDNKTQAL